MKIFIKCKVQINDSVLKTLGIKNGVLNAGLNIIQLEENEIDVFDNIINHLEYLYDYLQFYGIREMNNGDIDIYQNGGSACGPKTNDIIISLLKDVDDMVKGENEAHAPKRRKCSGLPALVGNFANAKSLVVKQRLGYMAYGIAFGKSNRSTIIGQQLKLKITDGPVLMDKSCGKVITKYMHNGEEYISIQYQGDPGILLNSKRIKSVINKINGPICLVKLGQYGDMGEFGMVVYMKGSPVYQYGITFEHYGRNNYTDKFSELQIKLIKSKYGLDINQLSFGVKINKKLGVIVNIGNNKKIIDVVSS